MDQFGETVPSSSFPATQPLFEIGEVVGDTYRLVRVIGEGACGRVYEAFDEIMQRKVAIKVAHRDPQKIALLRREARALAAVRHSGSVMPYAAGTWRGIEYLVMELLGGITLDDVIARHRARGEKVALSEVVSLLLAIANALAAVHRAGIAHRDVKPGNIVVASGDRVVLVDFGLVVPEIDLGREEEEPAGTPAFMAPEVIANEVRAGQGHLVDLYALGIVAHELLTGEAPFTGDTIYQTWSAHLMAHAPDVDELRRGVPSRLATLVRELLSKEPSQRPPTAESVAWQLKSIQASLAVRARARMPFVLIVDDDPDIAELVERCVKTNAPHAETCAVDSAEAALVTIGKQRPTLMILDLGLPKMNGVELCMDLRGAGLSDDCAIIAISGSAGESEVGLLFDLGVTHFVPKDAALLPSIAAIVRTVHPPEDERRP